MPSTSLGFPYPSASDDPDVPADMQAALDAVNVEFIDRDLRFLARRTTSFTISVDATFYPLVFNEELYDPGAVYDPATGAFTAPRSGWVRFRGTINVGLNSGSVPAGAQALASVAELTAGGAFSAELARGAQTQITTLGAVGMKVDEVVQVTSGTKYGLTIYVDASGVAKAVPADGKLSQFSAQYVVG